MDKELHSTRAEGEQSAQNWRDHWKSKGQEEQQLDVFLFEFERDGGRFNSWIPAHPEILEDWNKSH